MAPKPPPLGPNRLAPKGGPSRSSAPVAPKLGPNGKGGSGEKKVRGVLGPFDRAMDKASSGLLGAITSAISMPQQVVYKAGQGLGDIVTGHPGVGARGLKGALGEFLSLGQAGGNIDFATAIGQYDEETGKHVPKKLPKGLNTTVDVVGDPLNFVTFGAGTAAKQAAKTAATGLPKEAAERLATQGFKKGLTDAEQGAVWSAIEAGAKNSKNAAKTADKQVKQLALRGRGGVTVRIPGTSIGGTAVSGETAAKVGEKTGLTAGKNAIKSSAPGKFVRAGLVPGARAADTVGARASEELLSALDAKGAAETNRVNDLVTRWNAAVSDFEDTAKVKFTPEQDRLVSQALQSGDIAAAKAANPELARLIDTGDAIRKGTFEANVEAGTLADDIARDQDSYMHRTRNPEVVKALGDKESAGLYEGGGLSKSMTPGSAKARVLAPDSTEEGINEAINRIRRGEAVPEELVSAEDLPAIESVAKKMDDAKLPADTPYYRESAVASLVESGVEGARAVETSRMMDQIRGVKSDNGTAILHNAEDLKALGIEPTKEGLKAAGLVEFEVPKLGKFYAPPAVKEEITKFSTVMEDDIVGKARKSINTWDRWWRGQVTASLPGGVPFASRNARTNVMLTALDGMPPTYFGRGGAFQLRVRNVVKKNAAEIADNGVEKTMKNHLGDRDFEIWKAARENGVIGDGFYNIDITDAPEIRAAGMPKSGGKLRRGARFVAGSKGGMMRGGRAVNNVVEQHARMSHFLYSIDRLGDLGEAAARTNTVLFDYGKVTPFEQKILKKVLPFWTFMRKNLPGQVRAFVENPVRITAPEKLSALASDPVDEDAPEYQRRRGDRISRIPGIAGMIATPERPWQAAVSSLEPIAQAAGLALPGNALGLEPERKGAVFSSLGSMVGGGPAALGKAILDEGGEASTFSGGKLNEEEMRQRLLKAVYPALGRAPVLTGRLPSAVAEQKTKDKARQKSIAQIAQMLGFKLEAQK
jgi:hypothetical protein